MKIVKIAVRENAILTAYVPDPEYGYQKFKRRPGILLAPGGAYLIHATREQEGVALDFIARGFNVYILKYSLGFSSRLAKETNHGFLDTDHHYPLPVLEMLEAIHILKERSEEMNLNPDELFLMGFSAGGHLCAAVGTQWNNPEYIAQLSFIPKENELKVAGMVLGYPLIHPMSEGEFLVNDPQQSDSRLMKDFLYKTRNPDADQIAKTDIRLQVTAQTIPAFIWHSIDDTVVNPINSTEFVLALQKNKIPCEYHLFDHGGHGLGLAVPFYAGAKEEADFRIAIWRDLAENWMTRQIASDK